LYRLHLGTVRRVVRSKLNRSGASADALGEESDLVHEVFIRAFRPQTRLNYDPSRSYQKYLTAIARHVVSDHLRARARQRRLLRTLAAGQIELSAGEQSAGGASHRECLAFARVRALLAALPAEQRGVYCARYEMGLSQREAAAAGGLSYQKFMSLELRLHAAIREGLRSPLVPEAVRGV
jgi:RNA polymerase sigma-70 factor (ECF subfamily)